MKRIAINGMGRIGRASLKVILNSPELALVALNDIASIDNMPTFFSMTVYTEGSTKK